MDTLEVTIICQGESCTVVFTDDQKLIPTVDSLKIPLLKKPADFEVGDMILVLTGTPYVEIESIP